MAHLRNWRIYYCGMSPRICGFAIGGLAKQIDAYYFNTKLTGLKEFFSGALLMIYSQKYMFHFHSFFYKFNLLLGAIF
jgi:hypothetical protein